MEDSVLDKLETSHRHHHHRNLTCYQGWPYNLDNLGSRLREQTPLWRSSDPSSAQFLKFVQFSTFVICPVLWILCGDLQPHCVWRLTTRLCVKIYNQIMCEDWQPHYVWRFTTTFWVTTGKVRTPPECTLPPPTPVQHFHSHYTTPPSPPPHISYTFPPHSETVKEVN